jgi:hypothetical protein
MYVLERACARHAIALRWAWLALVLLLAACNPGDNSGGDGGGAY